MKTSTKQSSNESENGNKSKPLLQAVPILNFYTRPFVRLDFDSRRVYDAKANFVFEFNDKDKKLQREILFALNDIDLKPIQGLKLELQDPISIFKDKKPLITIRGWGNLTGIDARNFSDDKASKIQDDFVRWFFYKVVEWDCL